MLPTRLPVRSLTPRERARHFASAERPPLMEAEIRQRVILTIHVEDADLQAARRDHARRTWRQLIDMPHLERSSHLLALHHHGAGDALAHIGHRDTERP